MTDEGIFFFGVYVAFFVAGFASVHGVARWLKAKGIVGRDINKPGEPLLPESAGIALLVPLWLFVGGYNLWVAQALDLIALACLATGYALVGFLDDTRNKFAGKPMGWGERALPIAVLTLVFAWNYAESVYVFPFVALFVGVIASLHNTFAGLNGWEVGTSWLMGLAAAWLLLGTPLFLPALAFNALVLGLLAWNVFPARVFPGDSGTLLLGALNAGLVALTADVRLMGFYALLFAPHFLDLVGLKWVTNAGDMTQNIQHPYALDAEARICLPMHGGGRRKLDFAKALVCLVGPLGEDRLVWLIWSVVAGWLVVAFLFFKPL
ncbi:MAG: hypothetical protein J4203_00935 [Candidatus Diapherotrites archaeon]|uniref:Uncharacterized protein n=1 Tax=Candidatus Iainarchaeum sp. TaxID=3101447 RepID=A0A8T4L6B4_9ARCH|nr:hypothetical protein [Candidatus Diapherotrites archaeon]